MTKVDSDKSKKSDSHAEKRLYCSFCGKNDVEVRKMIAGPNVFICDECTDVCVDIFLDEGFQDPELLPLTKKFFDKGLTKEIDLSGLGVKPRFNKLKFARRENHIFYLCPFSEPFNAIYSDHVRPVVQKIGFTIERADEIYGTQPIIEDIWESINSAEFIIADVTGRNPNVMYEIGMAHTVGKPVIIITQNIDDVPFDLKHHRCIAYSYTPRGCAELETKVSGTLAFVRGANKS